LSQSATHDGQSNFARHYDAASQARLTSLKGGGGVSVAEQGYQSVLQVSEAEEHAKRELEEKEKVGPYIAQHAITAGYRHTAKVQAARRPNTPLVVIHRTIHQTRAWYI
jgi:urocanate hydratase